MEQSAFFFIIVIHSSCVCVFELHAGECAKQLLLQHRDC
jgi:hypothetical protein